MTYDKKIKCQIPVTREEIKKLTEYDKHKALIDATTGKNNLDFPYIEALASEYCIRITMPDGNSVFLPITLTDGRGLDTDDGYLHRPLTEYELGGKKGESVREKAKAMMERKIARAKKAASHSSEG